MEFPEEPPRPARDPRIPDAHGSARSRAEYEVEVWLRRELAFLYGVERSIKRRARLRKEAWRAAAVAAILAMFAACWYIAAVSSDSLSSANKACPAKTATAAHTTTNSAATGSAHTTTSGSTNCAS